MYLSAKTFLSKVFDGFTGFVARVTRRVPHMEQELSILPKHLTSPQVF